MGNGKVSFKNFLVEMVEFCVPVFIHWRMAQLTASTCFVKLGGFSFCVDTDTFVTCRDLASCRLFISGGSIVWTQHVTISRGEIHVKTSREVERLSFLPFCFK